MKNVGAIILAAGRSSRMGIPFPKCLLPTGCGSLLEISLRNIKRLGVHRVVVVVPGHSSLIQQQLGNGYSYVVQRTPLGNADALKAALRYTRRLPPYLLVGMADSITLFKPLTLKQFVGRCLASGSPVGITLFRSQRAAESIGRVYLDAQGRFSLVHLRGAIQHRRHDQRAYLQGGYWFFQTAWLRQALATVRQSSMNREYNLTDVLLRAKVAGLNICPFQISRISEWSSVNTFNEYLDIINKIKNIHHRN